MISLMKDKIKQAKCEICGKRKVWPPANTCWSCAEDSHPQEIITCELEAWKLMTSNIVYHRIFKCSFRIESEGDRLVAKELHVANPDEIFLHDFEHMKEMAVPMFLELNGLGPTNPALRVKRGRQYVM